MAYYTAAWISKADVGQGTGGRDGRAHVMNDTCKAILRFRIIFKNKHLKKECCGVVW